jgi:hypothetical protein
MPERVRGARFGLLPLVLLWLTVHAVLLAALLGAKFLLTKTAVLVLLLVGAAVFVFTRFRASQRKLTHSPVA